MKLARLGFAFALLVAAGAAFAPPASAFQLPAYTKTQLKNGLTLYVMPTRRLPLVDMQLMVRAGSVNDPAGKEGLANLMGDMLTQGAGPRSAKQVAADFEFLGGDLSVSSETERIVVSSEVLSKDLATGLEIFHDVIVRPTFPEADFARVKEEQLGAIVSGRDDPSTVADDAMFPFLLGDSPLAHPSSGWEASVKSITRDDVVRFHDAHVRPNQCVLAVVGDVDLKTLVPMLEKTFADWKPGGEVPKELYDASAGLKGRLVRVIEKPEVTQTQIRLACMGVPRSHPDYYAIRVANTILGAGFTSRLVNEIRVVQGLTYSIRSRQNMWRNAGSFVISTFTRNQTLRKCIDATLGEVRKLRDEGPTTAELDKSKRFLTGQFPLGLQAPDDLADNLLVIDFYGLDPKFIETFDAKINEVTMEDVKRVLKTNFCVEDLRILVVTDPKLAQKELAGLGTIEVKPIP